MHAVALTVAAVALLGVLVRPWHTYPAWWAAGGALALVLVRALTPAQAGAAVARGLDVYLFLIGMMALAEFARVEGVFGWIAAAAVHAAHGSHARLFALVYATGVMTTAFLSNDATIVVLTPAVVVALADTDASPLPYAFACALVANAASTLLPIANPSNLLFFAQRMPPLTTWFASFGWASLAAIVATYLVLIVLFRRELSAPLHVVRRDAARPRTIALAMLVLAAAALVATASRAGALGPVTFALGAIAALIASTRRRDAPLHIARGIAWPIVVLTAGLFVIVQALDLAGVATLPQAVFAWAAHLAPPLARLAIAGAAAGASNVVNNLPVGLEVGRFVAHAHPPTPLASAALLGVNVGPNFSINGSLATVLWLAIMQRANIDVSALRFAAVGALATPLALGTAALLAR
ncbi:MAG TPA: SLC13 family permease [Candidatus Sulfotelmatobacter sp.]|nr:SLC13 family permease [Candidatus Sulfotelmatobacter sp.]